MNLALITAILVAIAALAGAWRTLRARTPHRAPRIALQLVAAVLLYLALFPPRVDEHFAAGTLVILTPGTKPETALVDAASTVTLPGAAPRGDVEEVPDLGTALRRHPDTARLRIVGGGLPPRDIDAARALPVEFDAAPLPKGIVDLSAPASVRAGSRFGVNGRVEGDKGGRIELRDPAGAVIAQSTLADDGGFALAAQAKSAGNADFTLRLLDGNGVAMEDLTVSVSVRAGGDLRVLMLAGAPDPELKYLRRWAADAGVELTSRIALSDGIAMQDGAAAPNAATFARSDLVIADERAWKALDQRTKAALVDAVRAGLGLVLRVTGPLPDEVATDWRGLGFDVRAADVTEAVSLQPRAGAPESSMVLTRRANTVDADHAVPLLRAADGSALAVWRAEGQGRIAVWWLVDSYRLALGGDAGMFGTLWSEAFATVARARGAAPPELPVDARVDQRGVICGLADDAFVEQPDAARIVLAVDPSITTTRCAAYWPARVGWHTLVSAGARWPFHVRAAAEGAALAAAENADATRALAGSRAAPSASATRRIPAPRWPFFLAWLVAAAASWWFERSRVQTSETIAVARSEPPQSPRWNSARRARAA